MCHDTVVALLRSFFAQKHQKYHHKLLIVGLDGGGKTKLCYKLNSIDQRTIPTILVDYQKFAYSNFEFEIWELGGTPKYRNLWIPYLNPKYEAIIFVVDSADRHRINEAKNTLHSHICANLNPKMNKTLLIYANKQDLHEAMSISELTILLELQSLSLDWKIQSCSAITGEGLISGFDWLITRLQ